jgi:hypothetical protein
LKNWPGARCRGLGQAPSASRWFKILNRGCYPGTREEGVVGTSWVVCAFALVNSPLVRYWVYTFSN